jgi:hypothetical protein
MYASRDSSWGSFNDTILYVITTIPCQKGVAIMTSKKDPIELDAVMLISHSTQSQWSFEDYTRRVIRTARIKCRKLSDGLKEAD